MIFGINNPYNRKSWIPLILGTSAMILCVIGNFYCKFASLSYSTKNTSGSYDHVGIWNYYNEGSGSECILYPSSVNLDASWKTARAFSVMTALLGVASIFFLWLNPFLGAPSSLWPLLSMTSGTCGLFQGFTMIFLNGNACHASQNNDLDTSRCDMGSGAYCTICATIVWFLTAASMKVIEPPTIPEPKPSTVTTVKYTQTTSPDGIKIVSGEIISTEKV